ncbi:MAG TPA: hypothetical protein EYP41_12920 [Anaerolineae bacterium]|nr:hypothetical protein [Anaerolineae bacterium]
METLATIHGEFRWLVLLVALVAIVKFAIGLIKKQDYTPTDAKIMLAYTVFLDIQLLMGLTLLIFGNNFNRPHLEHATTMIIAVVVAHLNAIWRKSGDSGKIFRNNIIVILLSLALILLGVIRLRGGWI